MESVDTVGRKREVRKRFRQLRDGLDERARACADDAIEVRLCALPAFEAADVVLVYLDIGTEVRTRGIIERAWAAGKTVALPTCVPGSREVRWYRVTSFDGLVRSSLGVKEPVPDPAVELLLPTGPKALAVVPGLTFDEQGFRLGYGGGFYDTFLARFGGVSVGLCREAQMSSDLHATGVVEPHDQSVSCVVTDKRVLVVCR